MHMALTKQKMENEVFKNLKLNKKKQKRQANKKTNIQTNKQIEKTKKIT